MFFPLRSSAALSQALYEKNEKVPACVEKSCRSRSPCHLQLLHCYGKSVIIKAISFGGVTMKICSLIENTTTCGDLHIEHGLSLYIEAGNRKILFDSGQSGIFTENAERLGIDLTEIDLIILSHGHYDHGGGLLRFLEVNKTAPIYMSRHAFSQLYDAEDRYIGLDPALAECGRIVFVDEVLSLGDGLTLYSCNDRVPSSPASNYGLTMAQGDHLVPDDFQHEQYLLIEEDGKKVLFSGCSHKGILNIQNWFRPDVLIGGFHFMKLNPALPDDADVLNLSAALLLQQPTVYYTCHCTGVEQFTYLKNLMGEQLHYLAAGDRIEI